MEDFGSLLSILNTYDCKTRADSVDWYEDDVTGMYHLRINLVTPHQLEVLQCNLT